MNRDMDLVRDILLKVEERKYPSMSELMEDENDKEERDYLGHNTRILFDAGYIRGEDATSMDAGDDWIALDLTWRGHEFLDAIRDPEVWRPTANRWRKRNLDLISDEYKIVKAV